MDRRFGFRWLTGLLMVALLAGVGAYAYNAGVAHGIAEGSRAIAAEASGSGAPLVVWQRPWGHGFGFFPLFPFVIILFWFFVARGLFWRGGWHHRGWGRRYDGGVPPAFDEWHRRAHAHSAPPSAPDAKA